MEIQEAGPRRDWGRSTGRWGGPRAGRLLVGAAVAALVGVGAWQQLADRRPVAPSPPQVDRSPLLTADAGTVGSGFTVLLGGDRPVLVDPSDGTVSPVRLPAGAGVLRSATRTAAGLIAVVEDGTTGPGRLYRIDASGTATPWGHGEWGRGDVVQPGQGGDVLVLSRGAGGAGTLASVGDAGRPRWERPVPRLTQLVGNTPSGLVVQLVPDVRSHEDGDLLLIDARSGAVRRRLGPVLHVLAVSARTVAATRVGCAPDCPLLLIDVATGRQRVRPLPGGPVPAAAAFTPDGARLAVSTFGLASGEGDAAAEPHTGRVLVLDVCGGRVQQVPGLRTGRSQAADVAWAPDGVVLLLGVKWPTYERIARWHPASDRLRALPAQVPGNHPPGSLSVQFQPDDLNRSADKEKS